MTPKVRAIKPGDAIRHREEWSKGWRWERQKKKKRTGAWSLGWTRDGAVGERLNEEL